MKNLPMNYTASELEQVFKNFGPVKPNGVNVRSQKVLLYSIRHLVPFELFAGHEKPTFPSILQPWNLLQM